MGCRQPIHALATGASQQAEDRGLIGAEESNQGRGIVLQHDANTAKRFSPRSRYVKPLFVVGARLGRPLMGGWIPFPQGLIGGSDPRREGELRRTSWRTSSPSPKPPQADRRGGRSLHDGPSGASPAGRVNGPQGRIFLPGGVGGVRRSPLPVRIRASCRDGRPQEAGGRLWEKASGPAPPRRTNRNFQRVIDASYCITGT